ncbi:Surface polysaccharide O-acyltransferase, integral membrane enzyme [Ruminococcaceae bacterium YAD3003]|nr:Surface polysaccharide O-acyltransferase, integral membrane enzyme [Ruminococcaceae bacterium YAD3003]
MSKRDSKFELMRIFAMVLIVVCHIFAHCINEQLVNPTQYDSAALFTNFSVYRRLVITDLACSLGTIGNNLFILLSGYFMINRQINISKQIVKIASEMIFIVFILMFISYIHIHHELIRSTVSIRSFNDGWWFAGYYLSIIIMAYIFNNILSPKIDRKKHATLLLILFSIISFSYIRSAINKTIPDVIVTGVFIFMLGGYIRLYNPLKKIKSVLLVLTIVIVVLMMSGSYYLYSQGNINNAIFNKQISYNLVINGYSVYSIPCVIIGVALFELFSRITIKNSNIINFIGSSTFIVYLLHDNSYSWQWFFKVNWIELIYYKNYGMLILYIGLYVLVIFTLGIILYSIFSVIFKAASNYYYKIRNI